MIIRNSLPSAITMNKVKEATQDDNTLQRLIVAIKRGYITKEDEKILAPYKKVWTELSEAKGMVLRGSKVVVPQSLQKDMVTLAHEGHQGIERSKQYLRMHGWFPKMDIAIEKEVATCMACQIVVATPQREPLKVTELPQHPWEVITSDLHGPLPTGEYLLVVQCLYSRYPVVEIVSSTSAKVCIPVFDKIFSLFGIPERFTSDNGPPYNSEEFDRYSKYMGFTRTSNIPYAPWANGTVENFMKNLGKLIETSQEEAINWRQELHKFLRAYRATPHPMTKKSPATLIFNGRNFKTRLPSPTTKNILVYDKEVRKADREGKQCMKRTADKKRYVKPIDIKEGDQVLCRQKKRRKHDSKISREILTVIKRKGSLIYRYISTGREHGRTTSTRDTRRRFE